MARCTAGAGRQSPGGADESARGSLSANPTPPSGRAPAPAEQLRSSPFSTAQGSPSLISRCFSHFPATQIPQSSSCPPMGLGSALSTSWNAPDLCLGGPPKCLLCHKEHPRLQEFLFSLEFCTLTGCTESTRSRLLGDSPPLRSSGSVSLSFQDLVCCRRLASGHREMNRVQAKDLLSGSHALPRSGSHKDGPQIIHVKRKVSAKQSLTLLHPLVVNPRQN